jgi:hypothetical protein
MLVMLLAACTPFSATAADAEQDPRASAQRSEQLRQRAVEFGRDLLMLEEAVIPADQRVTVFVSESRDLPLALESAEIRIDPDVSIRKRYDRNEAGAISAGGSHRLYTGALPAGRHVLEVEVSARDADGRTRHFSSKLSFRAGHGPRTLDVELNALDGNSPDLVIHESG